MIKSIWQTCYEILKYKKSLDKPFIENPIFSEKSIWPLLLLAFYKIACH